MTRHTIPRAAFAATLKLIRLPADSVLMIAGGGSSTATVKLTLDRVEATARELAGNAVGDPVLKADGARRRAAAAERARALRLREEAEYHDERADERVAHAREAAAERKRSASRKADRQRAASARRRDAVKGRAAQTAAKRQTAAHRDAVVEKEAVDRRSKRARLNALDAKAEALKKEEKALTAADESQRLREAAAKAKAERKSEDPGATDRAERP